MKLISVRGCLLVENLVVVSCAAVTKSHQNRKLTVTISVCKCVCDRVCVCESLSVRAAFQNPSVSRPLCPLCVMSVKSSLKLHVRNYVHLHTDTRHTHTQTAYILAQTCIFIWHFKCMTLLKQLQRFPLPARQMTTKGFNQKDALIIFAQSFRAVYR